MYAELLATVTFTLVAYQDFRERLVADWAWVPAAAGAVLMFIERPAIADLLALKLALFVLVGLASIYLGVFGQADGLALMAMPVGVSVLSPMPQLFGGAIVALAHIAYLFVINGFKKLEKTFPVEEAVKQDVWIPLEVTCESQTTELSHSPERAWEELEKFVGRNAVVRASYGVPFAGYLAIGYISAFLFQLAFGRL